MMFRLLVEFHSVGRARQTDRCYDGFVEGKRCSDSSRSPSCSAIDRRQSRGWSTLNRLLLLFSASEGRSPASSGHSTAAGSRNCSAASNARLSTASPGRQRLLDANWNERRDSEGSSTGQRPQGTEFAHRRDSRGRRAAPINLIL